MNSFSSYPLIFKTQRPFNDFAHDDMQFGDISADLLQNKFGLRNVSNYVDPYKLVKKKPTGIITTPSLHLLEKIGQYSTDITYKECAKLMFNEFITLTRAFNGIGSGTYAPLIERLVRHMQYGQGTPYFDPMLDLAFERQINNDSKINASKRMLANSLSEFVDWNKKQLLLNEIIKPNSAFLNSIAESILPKFNRTTDNFNGMRISVHDVYAISIRINPASFKVQGNRFGVDVYYQGQDHFGLDQEDMLNPRFKRLRIFPIWFVLQRYDKFKPFCFKPFFTNMKAKIRIEGQRN